MAELWREHPTISCLEVSESGKIRLLRDVRSRKAGEILKQHEYGREGKKYLRICLGGKRYAVHVLVCETWHGERPEPGMIPHHNDSDGMNNHKDNLEWCDRKTNQRHAYANGLVPLPKGEKNGMAKLDEGRVRLIRHLYKWGGQTQKHLAEVFGVTFQNIHCICARKSWRHVA